MSDSVNEDAQRWAEDNRDDRIELVIMAIAYDEALVSPSFICEHIDDLEGVAVVAVGDYPDLGGAPPQRRPVMVDVELPDPENCRLCGRRVSRPEDAYLTRDMAIWHLDCDDPKGQRFGDNGMPTHETEGTRLAGGPIGAEVQRRLDQADAERWLDNGGS